MIRLRAQQILIETPTPDSEPWIRLVVQRVEEKDGLVNTVDRWDTIHNRLSVVADQAFPIVTDISNDTFTVGDLAKSLELIVINWLAVQYAGVIDENNYVIIEE
jgi:hypothetical protein